MTAGISQSGRPVLRSLRTRWATLADSAVRPSLTLRLLASYTVDPLVPYLGVHLHDAGLPARLTVAPFNQIVQQCLDDGGQTALMRPDVLVVAPRFEELATSAAGQSLLQAADAALAAARRWQSCLVFFLPAIPEERAYGAGDAARRDGTAASAAAVREQLRFLLAGRANVGVVDTEDAIRAIGARQAHRPALYRHARIPYGEEAFDLLARQAAALLRIRYRGGRRVVVLDADSLVREDGPLPGLDELAGPLGLLRQAGTRLAVRTSQDADTMWPRLDASLPQLTRDPQVTWMADDRPPLGHLTSLAADQAAGFGAEISQFVLITADTRQADLAASAAHGAPEVLVLAQGPERWQEDVLASGLLDQVPGPSQRQAAADDGPRPTESGPRHVGQPAPVTLAEFVAGLDVHVTFRDLAGPLDEITAEVIDRAHDFTLGRPLAPDWPADRVAFAADVTDRLGDYGTGAVVLMSCSAQPAQPGRGGRACRVDAFSVSCPALGRGVEEAVLREIVARADLAGCDAVVLEHQDTGKNAVAVDFLRRVAGLPSAAPSGREIQVLAPLTGATP